MLTALAPAADGEPACFNMKLEGAERAVAAAIAEVDSLTGKQKPLAFTDSHVIAQQERVERSRDLMPKQLYSAAMAAATASAAGAAAITKCRFDALSAMPTDARAVERLAEGGHYDRVACELCNSTEFFFTVALRTRAQVELGKPFLLDYDATEDRLISAAESPAGLKRSALDKEVGKITMEAQRLRLVYSTGKSGSPPQAAKAKSGPRADDGDNWTCPACKGVNWSWRTECYRRDCKYVRDKDASDKSQASWLCSECDVENESWRNWCSSSRCKARRPADRDSRSGGRKYKRERNPRDRSSGREHVRRR